jgi:2-dehydro-3-deoxy-D-arabinonate dehydratase
MQLVKFASPSMPSGVGILEQSQVIPLTLPFQGLSDILEADDPAGAAQRMTNADAQRLPLSDVRLLAPIDRQEVWAAGVTYIRSRKARMDESVDASTFYDKVYDAPRPELFFKATPRRVSGPGEGVRIRQDTKWSVPEPELTLVLNSRMKLVGFTVGNDMSARDIEGENPLYLPQAKVYDGCCALGPCITLARAMPAREKTGIRLVIRRGGGVAFEGTTDLGKLARTYDDLIGWVSRDNHFRDGLFLLTGTGIVPPDDFSLAAGDVVEISIDGIGTLANPVVQG